MCLLSCVCLCTPPDVLAFPVLVQGLQYLGCAAIPLCSFLLLLFCCFVVFVFPGNLSWNLGRSD